MCVRPAALTRDCAHSINVALGPSREADDIEEYDDDDEEENNS